MGYDIPILIIAFNRPEISKETFEVIRKLQPSSLYVAIDGARHEVSGEAQKVKSVCDIYHEVNWTCKAHYKINQHNLGAEITVSNAISWVLNDNEYCIILEDDILATRSFFDFARQMLLRYKDENKVYQVSAAQFTPMASMTTDYVFSLYGHTGFGWATWRRAWANFSMNITDFDKTLNNQELKKKFSCPEAYHAFIGSVHYLKANGSENCSWDRCWAYIRSRDGGLSIVPRCNLTQNIGLYGLHANGVANYHKFKASDQFVVSHHPSLIDIDYSYDEYHYKKYLYHSLLSKIIYKLKSLFR